MRWFPTWAGTWLQLLTRLKEISMVILTKGKYSQVFWKSVSMTFDPFSSDFHGHISANFLVQLIWYRPPLLVPFSMDYSSLWKTYLTKIHFGYCIWKFFYILCTKAKRSTKLHKFRFYSHAGQCRSFGVVAFSRCLTSLPLVCGKTKGEDMWWATFLLIMLLMEGEAVWLDWGEKL